ncbi:hypothetical protein LCGC14_0572980 [marine sediment metagenome]|uniref:Uncharacterized protein n=1 Tax=marine sediment metagenome TaxID=412755 RepID=A0A0F9S2C8_9ZZZZ
MSEIKAEQILEIHPDSRYVLVLAEEDYDDDILIMAGDIISDWWHGREEQTPILLLPAGTKLRLVRAND